MLLHSLLAAVLSSFQSVDMMQPYFVETADKYH